MALRVAGKSPAPQDDEQPTPVDPNDPDNDGDDDSTPEGDTDNDGGNPNAGGGQVDPNIAGYMGPDQGPFMCANCVHFQAPNACEIISGQVDHLGCCNLFTSSHAGVSAAEPDTGDDEDQGQGGPQTATSLPTTEPDEAEGT